MQARRPETQIFALTPRVSRLMASTQECTGAVDRAIDFISCEDDHITDPCRRAVLALLG
ncbi:hypothetical protein DOTSEDRAFT_40905 [Dothistroma septosporum NZE10]|uniref:Uncharacterized protein n=1 Tax=Dothistroma septosporum (strain NZE10 / CBS 128990) TaxID=675120 RepID=N1Q3F1_DOTSN|nr:hypothetical protein DOTSEDRAFT_40905 [Dothistroma septosporum NZE10]